MYSLRLLEDFVKEDPYNSRFLECVEGKESDMKPREWLVCECVLLCDISGKIK